MEYVNTLCFDIAGAGGGLAGVAAAVEAARSGKKVVLIEKTTQLGGLATIGLINLFVPMCNGRGVQIIKGMADEFLRLSVSHGFDTIPQEWKNGEPGFRKTGVRLISRFSAPIFSLELCELLDDLGVKIMFDTVITGVNAREGHIDSLILFNKSGYMRCCAKMFVDASGDADVLHYVGVPTVTRGNYHTYMAYEVTMDSCQKVAEKGDIAYLTHYRCAGGASLYGHGHPEGMKLWDGTDGEDVSRYLVANQKELLKKLRGDDRKGRDITLLPIMPQFRTTRRIDGNSTLTEADAYRHFEDSVCAICDFDRRDFLYEVSYGTLIRDGFDNVIAAGRCTSADGYAWDVVRVIPPAILTGQAAGAAASQAIDTTGDITNMDITRLQHRLASENVMIHFDDAWIPADRTKIEIADIGHF